MKKATDRQHQLVRFIADYVRDNGMPPTLREMATHIGASSSAGAVDHIKALAKKGYVKRVHYRSRGTTLTAEGFCLARDIELRGQLG